MNILYLSWFNYNFNLGGGALFSIRFIETVKRNKADDIYFLYLGEYDLKSKLYINEYKKNGINYISIINSNLTFDNSIISELDCYNYEIEQIFIKIIKKYKIDIVHMLQIICWPVSILKICHENRLPIFLTIQDFRLLCPLIIYDSVHSCRCNLINKKKCNNCVNNKMDLFKKNYDFRLNIIRYYFNEYLTKAFVHTPLAIDYFSANGFDKSKLDLVNFPAIKCKKNLKTKTPKLKSIRIGYLSGVFNKEKGWNFLINVFLNNYINNNKIILVLYGLSKTDFIKQYNIEPKNIIFKERYNDNNVCKIYNDFDIAIIPSCIPDFGPNVIFQSFECICPVIISDAGGMPALVKNNVNGYIYKYNNKNSLKKIIDNIVSNPEIIYELKKNIPEILSYKEYVEKIYNRYINYTLDYKRYSKKNLTLHNIYLYNSLNTIDKKFFEKLLLNNLKNQLSKDDKIIIYGFSETGAKIITYLQKNKYNIIAIIDKNFETKEYENINIFSSIQYLNFDFDKIIISSLGYQTEIYDLLKKFNVLVNKIICYYSDKIFKKYWN